MSHVGIEDHYDPPTHTVRQDAENAARAMVGTYYGMAFVEAIATLDAAAEEEYTEFLGALGDKNADKYNRADLDSVLYGTVTDLSRLALDYIEAGVRSTAAMRDEFTRQRAFVQINKTLTRLRPYCRDDAALKVKCERIAGMLEGVKP